MKVNEKKFKNLFILSANRSLTRRCLMWNSFSFFWHKFGWYWLCLSKKLLLIKRWFSFPWWRFVFLADQCLPSSPKRSLPALFRWKKFSKWDSSFALRTLVKVFVLPFPCLNVEKHLSGTTTAGKMHISNNVSNCFLRFFKKKSVGRTSRETSLFDFSGKHCAAVTWTRTWGIGNRFRWETLKSSWSRKVS